MIYGEQKMLNYYLLLFMILLTLNCLIILSNKPKEIIIHDTTHNTTYNVIVMETKCLNNEDVKTNPNKQPEPVISKDTYLLAHIINAEAGNQPYNGKVAVGNVIMNRVASSGFPDTIKDVIYQKGQFSPVANGTINKEPSAEAMQAAKDVMNGKRVVGKNVLFFYEPNIATDGWIRTRKVVTKIGNHVFAL